MKEFEPHPYQKVVFDKVMADKKFPPLMFGHRSYSVGVDIGQPGGDHTVVSVARLNNHGKIDMIFFDEYDDLPSYRWYAHPIKWWKLRRLWRKIDNNYWVAIDNKRDTLEK